MVETVNGRPAYKVSFLITLKRWQWCWWLKVDNGILMLTTSFKSHPRSCKKIVDSGDQKGQNRHQLLKLVTDTFCVQQSNYNTISESQANWRRIWYLSLVFRLWISSSMDDRKRNWIPSRNKYKYIHVYRFRRSVRTLYINYDYT